MQNQNNNQAGPGKSAAEHEFNSCPAPKWASVLGDQLFPMPRQKLQALDILHQSGIDPSLVLARDHGGRDDVAFEPESEVDLAEGNVFRAVPECDAPTRKCGKTPAKLAFVCDDDWEVTLIANQTLESLRGLFNVGAEFTLIRDYESPEDETIEENDIVKFADGPVFQKVKATRFCINIEDVEYPWPEPTITTAQIRDLGKLPADQPVVCEDAEGQERTLQENEVVTLDECCRFGRAPKYKRG